MTRDSSAWRFETKSVHAGWAGDPTTKAVAVPLYQTVAYSFDSAQHGADLFDLKVAGNIYTRIRNPTQSVLEERVAALEGGIAALALASGQAAITYAIQTIAEAGDNIVSSSALYGGTYNLFAHTLPQYGIQTRFADAANPASFEALIDDKTKAIYCESLGNPLGNITDIAALAAIAHRHGVPLIGINQGRLGFITDIPFDSFRTVLPPMLRGDYAEDLRSLMHGQVWRDGRCVFDALAMNDVVVNRGASSGMVELRVEVDGHFVANQRADGLIVATPTGSTAYSLSAGGPLLHPATAAWVMVPIAPHTLSNRPIVLADPAEIAIELVSGRDASANFDMQSLASLMIGDRITVRRSQHGVRVLHPRGWNYFDTLREKLHWNRGAV